MPIKKIIALLLVSYISALFALTIALSHWREFAEKPAPDFVSIEQASERKAAFFQYLRPLANTHNALISLRRHRLLQLAEDYQKNNTLNPRQQAQLAALADQYDVDKKLDTKQKLQMLRLRVDTIPVALVLVQAAKESAWGRSRFARKGNNYFGHWCFRKGCGLIPQQRKEGAYHEVRRFNSTAESVAAYMHNLNTHRAYRQLRELRAQQRNAGNNPSAFKLAEGLASYSEKGKSYVEYIQQMIITNHLE